MVVYDNTPRGKIMIVKCLPHVVGWRDLLESDAEHQRLREALDT
jgi:hypothetical protein